MLSNETCPSSVQCRTQAVVHFSHTFCLDSFLDDIAIHGSGHIPAACAVQTQPLELSCISRLIVCCLIALLIPKSLHHLPQFSLLWGLPAALPGPWEMFIHIGSHGESSGHFDLSWGSWISKIISLVGVTCSSAPHHILHPCNLIHSPLLPLHQWQMLRKLAILDAGFGVLCNEAAGTFSKEVLSLSCFFASCHYDPSLCQCQVLFFYGHWLMHANKFLYRQGPC